ncbi:hypothetical protein B484DRAFT_460210 [Ochromonadaceae sp. CCMP2298]|nr:hypothetical protein B484DRAFT_460210 [Ochromonadaceae sp. CCMP2298]
MSKGAAFWKTAGLSYLQYLNISARTVRAGMKPTLKTATLAREAVAYTRTGTDGAKVRITSSLPM